MSILMSSDVRSLFAEHFDAALDAKNTEVSSPAKEYLLGLLADYALRNQIRESGE